MTPKQKHVTIEETQEESHRMKKETAYQTYRKQLVLLANEYHDIFRDTMRDALVVHTKKLTSALLKQADRITLDDPLPQLLTIIPDIYIKEDILAQTMQNNGRDMPKHFLMKMRTEKKRTKTLPYVIMHLQNGENSLEYPANTLNFLEKIFFFMYSGKFPSKDTTYQKLIIA
ncbi:MAG: hypothetical protein Q8O83_03640 [bacterium]|nr:hypothetical protein [bacterium]